MPCAITAQATESAAPQPGSSADSSALARQKPVLQMPACEGAGFFTLSKRKGTVASFRLKTARLDRFHGGSVGRPRGSLVHWVRPELVAGVKFLTWTDDNLLGQVGRAPVSSGFLRHHIRVMTPDLTD